MPLDKKGCKKKREQTVVIRCQSQSDQHGDQSHLTGSWPLLHPFLSDPLPSLNPQQPPSLTSLSSILRLWVCILISYPTVPLNLLLSHQSLRLARFLIFIAVTFLCHFCVSAYLVHESPFSLRIPYDKVFDQPITGSNSRLLTPPRFGVFFFLSL